MTSWKRSGYRPGKPWDQSALMEHQVLLYPNEWFSIINQGKVAEAVLYGQDMGRVIYLHRELQQRIRDIQLFKRYTVHRRALNQLFTGRFDAYGQPVFAEKGEAYHPNGLKPQDFGRIGLKYDIAISFASAKEAVTFRTLLSGVL